MGAAPVSSEPNLGVSVLGSVMKGSRRPPVREIMTSAVMYVRPKQAARALHIRVPQLIDLCGFLQGDGHG